MSVQLIFTIIGAVGLATGIVAGLFGRGFLDRKYKEKREEDIRP